MTNKYDEIMARLDVEHLQENHHAVTTEQDLKVFEEELGFSLPEDYRLFLMSYGDTTSKAGNILVTPMGDSSNVLADIEVFYGLGRVARYSVASVWRQLSDRLPKGVIAIASSPGGEIFLSVNQANPGIYWWDRVGSFRAENTQLLAVDFDSFVRSLRVGRGQ